MTQWECWESGGGVLEITSQGTQVAPPTPPGASGGRLKLLDSLLKAFHLGGLGVLETISGGYHPSPRAMPDGVLGVGNTMPVSHISTLIC